MSQNRKITDPPTNVKEAIDWLIRIGELDKSQSNGGSSKLQQNCTALYKAIKALTGSGSNFSNDIKTLISDLSKFLDYSSGTINGGGIIKKDGNYTSAYNQNAAQWPTCSKGGTCSCCQQGSCNCTASPTKSCDGSCCNTCDVRICAGIFVALVPALETALRGLKDKLKKENGTMINQDPIKGYFTALGYQEGDLNTGLKGNIASSMLGRATRQLEEVKKRVLGRDGYFKGIENSASSTSVSSSSSNSPRTIREMLLWLMGLPYCQGYGEFVKKLTEETLKNLVTSTRTPSKDDHYLHRQLSAVIFHLPTVFYAVEGRISYLKEVFEQFNDKAKPRFCYPTEGDKLLNTLSAYVAVCYPILKYLMQRCDKPERRTRRGAGAGTTPTEEKDGSWGDCLVSGAQGQSQPQAPSSVPKTALRDFLVFMGFKSVNGTVTGDQLHDNALAECFSPNVKTDDEDEDDKGPGTGRTRRSPTSKDQKLPALRKLAKHVLQGLYSPSGGSSSNGTTPTTIRQMMLWLIGLPLTEAYKSNSTNSLVGKDGPVLQGIKSNEALKELEQGQQSGRLRGSTTAATGKHFKQQLKDSIVGMIMLFQRIEGGLGSVLEFLKEGFKDGGAKEKFKYEQDQQKLFTEFNTYVYKVHTQLRFLKVMCKTDKKDGGWKECLYDNTSGSGVGNNITCGCSYISPCCAFPLKHFLTNNGTKEEKNKFQLCNDKKKEHLQMGFKAYDPQSSSGSASTLTGSHIYNFLKDLIDPINTPTTTPKPLSLLTQYCVAIGNMDPVSLGDHFDLFRELANGMWDKIKGDIEKNSLAKIRTTDNEGIQAGNALQGALQAVWPSSHKEHNDGDLRSLTGCNETQKCSPFVASLSHGLYRYFDPTKLSSPAQKIDWLYMKMSALYGKLTKLKKEMEKECQCCPKGTEASSSSSCAGITNCPSCLPQLYKMGLVFGDPKQLTSKKCSDLMDMMESVLVTTTSKLCVVFRSIDSDRFWPYLLFSAMVVKENKKWTDSEVLRSYTAALEAHYRNYVEDKKKEDEKEAEKNKSTREGALKCNCQSHTYEQPQAGSGTATVVTLTLYFQDSNIKTTIQLVVPHHGPLYNPLVRLYPRNLKSIVDWLLRIGQTRLEQKASAASTKDTDLEDMITMFWPKIRECVKDMDQQENFKLLVTNVRSLMGLKTQGKKEVEKEVNTEYEKAKDELTKKLSGSGDGFDKTFEKILKFNPKDYIDEVIKDFGKQVKSINSKERSFECIAKSLSTCMSTALQKIKELAGDNKTTLTNYDVKHIEGLGTIDDTVSTLNDPSTVEKLFKCFKTFFTSYENVLKVLGSGLQQAQDDNNDGKNLWIAIQKYTGAFYYVAYLSIHVKRLERDSTMGGSYDSLEILIQKLTELERHNESLKGDEQKLTDFIKKVEDKVTEIGKKGIEEALNIKNGSTTFDDVVKMFLSTVVDKYKTDATILDKIFYHLPVFSECLKAMVEIYNTGMKEFITELKTCLETAKGHINKIHMLQIQLKELKDGITYINDGTKDNYKDDGMTFILQKTVESIKELLSNHYIYQTQPIVSTFITQDDVNKMTTYLKSLPDLIRDRYVLQKWKDDAKHFCGVQEFKGGIVKRSDITGITGVLKSLLKDTFHSDATSDVTIHDFQVRSLIYNFCHKEGIKGIGEGVECMECVTEKMNESNGNVEWRTINTNKDKLLALLKNLSENAYLRYFATHLRDSIGYHTLSNTLGALEQVKEKLGENNGSQPEQWDKIQDLLKKDTMETLHTKLQSLVDKLNREYIFEYPPFDWQKSCKRLVKKQDEAEKAARQKRSLPTSPSPASPSTGSNTCSMCTHSMAHIFIGFVPQMYRLFKMLREIAQKEGYGSEHKLVYENNGTDSSKTTMSSLAGILSREGWRMKDGSGTSGGDEAFDLEHTKTGDDLCKLLDEIIGDKEPGVLVAQRENNVSTTDLKPLDQLFKAVMQHFKEKRNEKIKKRIQELKTRFEADPNNAGLKFVAPPAPLPSTVRQVLFWLHEMDCNKTFYDQMSQHIGTLCNESSIPISQDTILHVLKLSITQCLEVLATIEDPGRQNAQYYYDLYTEEHYYAYPVVNIPLFFYTFVEKLMGAFLELNFVCVQCEFRALEGGWSECHIGEVYNKAYDISGGTSCICHERKLAGPALLRIEVEGSLVCPKPLSAFLFSDQKNQLRIPGDVSQRLAYMSKGTMPCGFQLKNKAITDAATPGDAPTPTSVSGSVLVEPLRKLVGGHVKGRHGSTTTNGLNTLSTVIYLRDLLRYTLCLAVRPPWSMSENMAFFYRLTESWKKDQVYTGVRVAQPNTQLLQSIHAEIALFPGTFDGKKLTTAVERFASIEDKEHQTSVPGHSNTSHHYDLRTLMGCKEANATSSVATPVLCSYFMFPLSLDVYTHYDHRNSRAYLSWILNFAFGIYGQLRGLEEMIKKQKCVRIASQSTSQCPSLPMCPGVLTALYQSGSSFMDQGQLAKNTNAGGTTTTTKKTCRDFHSVLNALFNCETSSCTPLHNLIVQCEAFLWSIRLPFSLVQLSLWSVAILFISYVFVVPLDHFKIKSHLFNRLKYTMHPSLLIADQQRRVSEVAYFSL